MYLDNFHLRYSKNSFLFSVYMNKKLNDKKKTKNMYYYLL